MFVSFQISSIINKENVWHFGSINSSGPIVDICKKNWDPLSGYLWTTYNWTKTMEWTVEFSTSNESPKKRLLKQSQIKEKIALNQFHIRIQAFNWRLNRVFSLCPLHKDSPKWASIATNFRTATQMSRQSKMGPHPWKRKGLPCTSS